MTIDVTEIDDSAKALELDEIQREKERYERQVAAFNVYAARFDTPGLNKFYWYHTVDLGEDIATPGDYDYRSSLEAFRFPDDMHGMRVLDIGSATGFFAFEFERRGAEVYSVELPSLLDWDMIADEREHVVRAMMQAHEASSFEDAHWRILDGPFTFCHQRRHSSIKRCFSTIYNLSPALFNGRQFDVVYLGDVLLHLFSPLAALNAIAPLCKHKLIIASDLMPGISEPILRFMGQSNADSDSRTWWAFTRSSLADMLCRIGFRNIVDAGSYSGIHRRLLCRYERMVIHATK